MTPAFFTIHSDLPREGPGDRAALDWALSLAGIPADARILDAGCGPGADIAGLLDHAPRGQVVAMETHDAYVQRVARAWSGDGRVRAVLGDMARPDGAFDLIWSAGAVYFLGVSEALRAWRDHLRPGGCVAFSELAWTTDDPAPAARAFWTAYPAMTGAAGVRARVADAGYRILGERFLPRAAWAAYYDPLQARVAALRADAPSAEMQQALAGEQAEIDIWRAHGNDFSYLQIVAAPA